MKPNSNFSSNLRLTALCLLGMLSVSMSPAATNLWTGASGVDTLWATPGNWNPSGPPGSSDTALFGVGATVTSATTVNNVVGADTTVAALSYTNSTSGTWHVTEIPSGATLTVNGTVTVGGGNATGLSTSAAMTGGGTFLATGNSFTLGNTAGSGSQTPGTLDLSGLSNFVYSASGGTIGLGTTGSRSSGNLTLAAGSNSITAGTININGATGTGSTPTFNLGAGTNVINVNTFNVGGGRSTTALQFASGTGGLKLRGTAGTDTDRTTMVVGNRNTGGTGTLTTTGNVFLNGHPVDMKLATLTLGLMSRSGTEANFKAIGVFQFDQGTVDATTVNMGVCSGASPTSGAIGTLTVGATGTLLVGNVSLANTNGTGAGSYASGTLNVAGGVVNCLGNIIKTTSTGCTGIVAVASGALSVAGSMGSSSNPIDSLNLTNATLTLRSAPLAPATVTVLNTDGPTNVINISSVPAITAYPAQFQVIQYSGTIGGVGFDNNVGLGTLPTVSPAFAGYLSNNTATLTIDLVITSGPAPAQPITWAGTLSGAWDTSTLNWLVGATPTNYNNAGDFVTFGDTASTSTVYLVTETLTPGSITVTNDSLTYTFTGSGKLSGSTGLTKQGSGTLILDNSGVNDFAGGVSLTGTLQLGTGGTSGNLPSAASVADNGTLVFNRSDNFTAANAISGTGAVVQNGPNTLTLSGANSYGGGLTVNAGTVRLTHVLGAGPGTMTVNSGGALVLGAAPTNAILLAGGTLGASVAQNPGYVSTLTAAPATTSTIYASDPQNLGVNLEMYFTNLLGSGNLNVLSGNNNSGVDGGVAFRLRGVGVSTFSGTITLGNNVKGEIQTAVAGPFSPAGTGKIVMTAGAYNGTNGTQAPVAGGYSELNVRNNLAGDTVFGNDVEITGTGLAMLNMAGTGSAGAVSTMGNLKVGGGQQVGVYKSSGNAQVVRFTSVTLTGGDVTFSPFTPGFGSLTSVNSDLSLGPISELTPSGSGIIMSGWRTLYLTGANTYSGNTVVNCGTLALSGSGSIANSPRIIVGADPTMASAILDASGRADKTLALVSGQTLYLTNGGWFGTGTQIISVGAGATLDALGRTNGTLTLAGGQTLKGNGTVTGTNIVVASGSTIAAGASVGTLSTGPQTWSGGGTNAWEINDATGSAGTGWDLLSVTGGIDVQATSGNPFTINAASLSGSNPGPAANFDNNTSYSWMIASVTDSVTNFDASKFMVNYSAVSNDLAGGYFFMESGSLKVSFTNNHPPAAALATVSRPKGLPMKIKLADLAVNWSDVDGDATALVSVNPSSTNGLNNVTADSTQIFYSPGTNGDVPDAITYTIRDLRSAYRPGDTVRTAVGTILIAIAPPSTNVSHNITGISTNGDGTVTISFAGVPNETYVVEAATNPAGPVWVPLSTNVAGPNGLWNFTDPDAASYPSRFYRSAHP